MLELRRPTLADKSAVLEMMTEFEAAQSAHDGGFWNSQPFDYEAWLQSNLDSELGLYLSDGWVPAIQFVSFTETGRAVGFLHLRLRLNDALLATGGHIGYSIRPSKRGRGYAKETLTLGLQVCQAKNIKSVLLTCSVDNPASRAVILGVGGVLEDIREGIERYWVDLM